ncbi:MAG: hypothetical protein Q8Q94_03800 [bacterium]|nr:hypothetical protein [bacterium]MDZ4299431.1 hypothetical protein [Candidatus Sungbacteria bacterium]
MSPTAPLSAIDRIRALHDRTRVALAAGAIICSAIAVFVFWSVSVSATLGRANFSPVIVSESAIVENSVGVPQPEQAVPSPIPAENLPAPVASLSESFKGIVNLLPHATDTEESSASGSLLSFDGVRGKISGAFGYAQGIAGQVAGMLVQGGIVDRLKTIGREILLWGHDVVLYAVLSIRNYAYEHLIRTTEGE